MQAIKRKKRHEAQLAQIDVTLTILEQQREALEGKYKGKAKSLKKAQQKMLDDIAVQQEISDAISSPTALANNEFDENELEAELEELVREEEYQEFLEEEKELAELEAFARPISNEDLFHHYKK